MAEAITPDAVLPDGVDGTEFGGRYVRKGTVRAAIENIKAMAGLPPESPSYQAHANALRDLTPDLEALELFAHFTPRDPHIAAIFGQ